jgi:hypothetical protein
MDKRDKERAQWEKTRQAGRWRYVLRWAALYATTGTAIMIFGSLIMRRQNFYLSDTLIIIPITFILGGLGALSAWEANEKMMLMREKSKSSYMRSQTIAGCLFIINSTTLAGIFGSGSNFFTRQQLIIYLGMAIPISILFAYYGAQQRWEAEQEKRKNQSP